MKSRETVYISGLKLKDMRIEEDSDLKEYVSNCLSERAYLSSEEDKRFALVDGGMLDYQIKKSYRN